MTVALFADFAPALRAPSHLRDAIDAACRCPEADCMGPLIEWATLDPAIAEAVAATARSLVEVLRTRSRTGRLAALVQEYALSSAEGVALMCLAEGLLRVPDAATRDLLIRDKLVAGDWRAHLGDGKSPFVNAATWSLLIAGKLIAPPSGPVVTALLARLVKRGGTPLIRRIVTAAMRAIGGEFILGETIETALIRARRLEREGFRHSYDMLGEAAMTARDAEQYFEAYSRAIHAIGRTAVGLGVVAGPGISIKLSALHPRYCRAQADRVIAELLPRVAALARLARDYDIALTIDAEEADRLELSLEILERLALDRDLIGWQGLGFVVQAYGKRCPYVIDYLIDLARRAERRIMVRLVKGAYWDTEIKRAQTDGLADFPVYTRKAHTDIAYIACARKLLAAPDAVFPQFATHNAQTVATIYHLAGSGFTEGQYEFQCLHGMGEPLYAQVVGRGGLDRPCRIYAPVGSHETLLAYLARRLLENGANSSFVKRLSDPGVPVDDLICDPVSAASQDGMRHEAIVLPGALYPDRRNSEGLDLSDEPTLASLGEALRRAGARTFLAAPANARGKVERSVRNPADHRDIVGAVVEAHGDDIADAIVATGSSAWRHRPLASRAACLQRGADLLQANHQNLIGLLVREAGKSVANALAESREAIDFLRYYAARAREGLAEDGRPLGVVVCISPWNFPLAIFIGQISAALVAGNAVIAKPAEQTPLIAAEAVHLLHRAGVPQDALRLVPGDGAVGAALVQSPAVNGVMFTGSTETAHLIQRTLAERLSPTGQPVRLIAETGGQNAMVVDSTALAEQVVADVLQSAFDSAGQRCSALRLLCLQDDVSATMLDMLKGAMRELTVGRPDRLGVDIGSVIDADAKDAIERHVAAMAARGHAVTRGALPREAGYGTFVPPTIIEIDRVEDLDAEVFGPVLHVLRYRRENLDHLLEAINATGYGLTFGVHSRLDSTVQHAAARVAAGNIYVNRNMVGAVVGTQPFGGRGLSGTGPKAGGPLYLGRLVERAPRAHGRRRESSDPALVAFADWLDATGEIAAADRARRYGRSALSGIEADLPGPVGERNRYFARPRGAILVRPSTRHGLFEQLAAVLATGNVAVVEAPPPLAAALARLPAAVNARLSCAAGIEIAAALIEGRADTVRADLADLARRPGRIVPAQIGSPKGADFAYEPDWLVEEVVISTNLAAVGGDPALMMIA